jgi:hypothetical protein
MQRNGEWRYSFIILCDYCDWSAHSLATLPRPPRKTATISHSIGLWVGPGARPGRHGE